jgi:protein phosphatase
VLDHWFVGVDEETDTVAVYRGINASVLGVDLYREEADSGVAVADLSQDVRSKVTDGIAVDDRQSAEDRVDMLREQALPICEDEATDETSSTSSAPSTPPAAPFDPSAGPTPFPTVPEAGAPAATTAAPTPTASPTSSGSSTSSGTGRDCREAE